MVSDSKIRAPTTHVTKQTFSECHLVLLPSVNEGRGPRSRPSRDGKKSSVCMQSHVEVYAVPGLETDKGFLH